MSDLVYELKISSNNALDILKEFVFDLGITCIEEGDNFFIIRDESDLSIVEFALKEFANRLFSINNFKIDLNFSYSSIENKDWIKEYKKGVKPIEIDRFYIYPSWYEPKKNFINILVDPSLAFGSGHHESTNMVLELISKYVDENKKLRCLDVGCGSGILSIALAKLNQSVISCDIDEQAIISTKENASKNGISLEDVYLGSIKSGAKFDLIVANIIAEVLIDLKDEFYNSLNNEGILIISGILDKYIDTIKSNFKNFKILEILKKNEWCSLVLSKGDI